MADTRIFLISGSSWTVPADCLSATIECIGGGGNGGSCGVGANRGGSGGGGGAYSKKNSLALTPGASISYQVGGVATDTWFKSTSDVLAKGGVSGQIASYSEPGSGGLASGCVGDVKYDGGYGGQRGYSSAAGAGGGGAAGKNGAGAAGQQAQGNTAGYGGTADNGSGGAGGTAGTYQNYPGNPGNPGTEWDATHGSGGGGAGGTSINYSVSYATGAAGGNYGGGGGGGGSDNVGSMIPGGAGKQGLIVITYTPVIPGTSKFFQLF